MNLPSILLWGFVATVLMSALLAGAQGLGFTRISIPFILGTIVSANRYTAMLAGFFLHIVNGWVFALFLGAGAWIGTRLIQRIQ